MRVLLLFFLCLAVSDRVAIAQADDPKPSASEPATISVGAAELQAGDTVIFLGDSITHQRLYTRFIEDFFITRFPATPLKFHNAGISGDRAWDALQRLDRDVISKDPALVTILLGMNDGRYEPFNRNIFETYRTDMSELLERLQQSGTTVAPITPTMYDAIAARAIIKKRPRSEEMLQEYNAVLAFFGTWVRGEADRREMQSIDMFGPLNRLSGLARQQDPKFSFIADAIHPGASGQLIMAHAWLHDLGMQQPVSNIVLTPTGKGYRTRVQGGKLTELETEDGVIEFDFLADSLPWVTPPETEKAAQMLKLGHKFSREGFQVHGLEAGKYELSIGDTVIGQFSHTQLAAHIELQRYPESPQSRQAATVVALNQKRNETTVRALRDHWFVFRNRARSERELSETTDQPTREKLMKRIESQREKMDGFEKRLAELESESESTLAEVYKAAQPVSHHYVLRKISK